MPFYSKMQLFHDFFVTSLYYFLIDGIFVIPIFPLYS